MYRELPTQGILRWGWKQGADASPTNLKVCFKGLSWFCVPIWSLGVFISPPEIPIFLPPLKKSWDFNMWYTQENQIRKLRPSFDGSTNFIKQIRKTSSQQFLADAETSQSYFLGPIYLSLSRGLLFFLFLDKPWAYTITSIFQFRGKPRAYTGWTYFRTYFTPPSKEQSLDILISDW